MNRCLYCYKVMQNGEIDIHPDCSKKIFEVAEPPVLDFDERQLEPLAKEIIQNHTAVAGVQAKLSLHITNGKNNTLEKRFTIVGLWGGYILKPPTEQYPELPEI